MTTPARTELVADFIAAAEMSLDLSRHKEEHLAKMADIGKEAPEGYRAAVASTRDYLVQRAIAYALIALAKQGAESR